MPSKKTTKKAKRALRGGKRPSTAAGEFVREEIEHVRSGKHGARSAKQAIAIGLSKARRAGIPLRPPRRGQASGRTRSAAKREYAAASGSRRAGAGQRKSGATSKRRSAASRSALKREPRSAGSHRALSAQARRASRTRRKSASTGSTARRKSTARAKSPARSGSRGPRRKAARSARKSSKKSPAPRARRYWSAEVMRSSDALDLEPGVFQRSPREIARSLRRSAERSARRKSSAFRSAMSMLTFYENRAGRTLPASRRRAIERAKDELRKLYGRVPRSSG